MDNPPISSPRSSPAISSARTGLRCPYCGHAIDLSWRRYWAAFSGHHKCSACGGKSKLKLNFAFVLVTGAVGMVLPIPTAILVAYGLPNFSDFSFMLWLRGDLDALNLAFALWVLGALALIFWLGPYFDRKYGVLHKTN